MAAEVVKSVPQGTDLSSLTDKAKHLHTLHALPASLWPEAAAHVLAAGQPEGL